MKPNQFKAILEKSGLPVSEQSLQQFQRFHHRLLDSNQKMNLISSGDESRIYERHFLDSVGLLSLVDIPSETCVLDLGSGAGFPGIPLKILRPDLSMILVESRQKRAGFLSDVAEKLGLEKVQVFGERMEDVAEQVSGVDFVVSRAVSSLLNLCRWTHPVLSETGGKLVVLKGGDLDEEFKRLNKKQSSLRIADVNVLDYHPFEEVESTFDRKLVVVQFQN